MAELIENYGLGPDIYGNFYAAMGQQDFALAHAVAHAAGREASSVYALSPGRVAVAQADYLDNSATIAEIALADRDGEDRVALGNRLSLTTTLQYDEGTDLIRRGTGKYEPLTGKYNQTPGQRTREQVGQLTRALSSLATARMASYEGAHDDTDPTSTSDQYARGKYWYAKANYDNTRSSLSRAVPAPLAKLELELHAARNEAALGRRWDELRSRLGVWAAQRTIAHRYPELKPVASTLNQNHAYIFGDRQSAIESMLLHP